MDVLLIKTSSLGDVLQTFPALSDALALVPGVRFDWLVEPAYAQVCHWHPAVARTIAVDQRRWRRTPLRGLTNRDLWRLIGTLRERRYDRVIDAQGLLKSAMFGLLTRGPRHGFDPQSVAEWPAALTYHRRHAAPPGANAVGRLRHLFAAALGYAPPTSAPDFGLLRDRFGPPVLSERYIVFNHGTAWPTKRWPVTRWRELAAIAAAAGYTVCLPWNDAQDRAYCEAVADGIPAAKPMQLDLPGIARALAGAAGAVGVETAFSHLAAALELPTVTLYGPTGPARHSTNGPRTAHLASADFPCSPCYGRRNCKLDPARSESPPCLAAVSAERVWRALIGANGGKPLGVPG